MLFCCFIAESVLQQKTLAQRRFMSFAIKIFRGKARVTMSGQQFQESESVFVVDAWLAGMWEK